MPSSPSYLVPTSVSSRFAARRSRAAPGTQSRGGTLNPNPLGRLGFYKDDGVPREIVRKSSWHRSKQRQDSGQNDFGRSKVMGLPWTPQYSGPTNQGGKGKWGSSMLIRPYSFWGVHLRRPMAIKQPELAGLQDGNSNYIWQWRKITLAAQR